MLFRSFLSRMDKLVPIEVIKCRKGSAMFPTLVEIVFGMNELVSFFKNMYLLYVKYTVAVSHYWMVVSHHVVAGI